MTISAILSPELIFINPDISSKKRLLEFLANTISEKFLLSQTSIYGNLLNRERLGSTGLGKGFAIPHARLSKLDTTIGCFIRLEHAVNFEAMDQQPVDLVFCIIIPEEATDEHLQILSSLAKIFSQDKIRADIRNAKSADQIVGIIDSAE